MKLAKKILKYLSKPPGVNPWSLTRNHHPKELKHHRKIMWAVPDKRFAPLFWIFYFVQLVSWYLFFVWKHLYKGLAYLKRQEKNHKPTENKQFKKLVELLFVYTIPYHSIIKYQLLDQARSTCLSHIYAHEIPKWQYAISNSISADEHLLLSDKDYFSKICTQQGIPCIETIHRIKHKASHEDLEKILSLNRSCFIKPPGANQSLACYALYNNADSFRMNLIGHTEEFSESKEIIQELRKANQKHSLIVQPMLRNISLWEKLSLSTELITMRIITEWHHNRSQILAAVLEIPIEDGGKFYDIIPIDPRSGHIHNQLFGSSIKKTNDRQTQLLSNIGDTVVPQWIEIMNILHRAHSLVPSIRTVGWDLALIERGPVLIEGNFGWNTKTLTKNELKSKALRDIEL